MVDLRPDAIIFVPGLGNWYDQSIGGVACRISASLDRSAKDTQARFSPSSETVEEEYGTDSLWARKTRLRSIHRKDADRETSVLDLYGGDPMLR